MPIFILYREIYIDYERKTMHIGVLGAGYVGLVTGTCLAEMGNHVHIVDIAEEKIARLREGKSPHFEPGLGELLKRNIEENRITFSSEVRNAVINNDAIFLAVGTPMSDNGSANLEYINQAAIDVAKNMDSYKTIIIKSTVPVGTNTSISNLIAENTTQEFDMVSNPEFLKEGAAIDDFMRPDRVVVGVRSNKAEKIMKQIYAPFVRSGHPIMVMNPESAEMVKYASNALLASRISFMNEMANICHSVGANVELVRAGVGSDRRLGGAFLFPGLGYGGSCFPKDVRALSHVAKEAGVKSHLCDAIDRVNIEQKYALIPDIYQELGKDLAGKKFAMWGLAFKPKTDDVREAPALYMIDELSKQGAKITAYDPEAIESTRREIGDKVEYAKDAYSALEGADALIICTEWNEFRAPDLALIKKLLNKPIIFDGRNLYDLEVLKEAEFTYVSIGRSKIN